MTAPTPKRGRGRPRKQQEKPILTLHELDGSVKFFSSQEALDNHTKKKNSQQLNPDCEPATKGYVKCVARKLISGPIDKAGGAFNSAIIWMIVAAGFTVTMFAVSEPHTDPFSTLNWATILFMISFVLGIHDVILGYYLFSYPEQYDYVQKHVEPPCEPKRGCEE